MTAATNSTPAEVARAGGSTPIRRWISCCQPDASTSMTSTTAVPAIASQRHARRPGA